MLTFIGTNLDVAENPQLLVNNIKVSIFCLPLLSVILLLLLLLFLLKGF